MTVLDEEMREIYERYGKLRSTMTLGEAKQLQPHTKALLMLLREMSSKHPLTRMDNKLADMEMFITGEAKRIDEEE